MSNILTRSQNDMKSNKDQSNGAPSQSPKGNNEREVLDPITHLRLVIHDITDVELDQIPPPLSNSEERRRERALASQKTASEETNRHHNEMEHLMREVTQRGWWHDPGMDVDHARMQAAIVAGVAAGISSIGGLFLWWFLGLFAGPSKRFSWLDLFILPLGCCLLAFLVGFAALSFKLFQTPPDQTSPDQKSHTRSPRALEDSDHESYKESEEKATQPPAPNTPESAGWLNSLLRSTWPVVNPALFTPLTDMLEDSLQQTLPKFVRGVRITDVGQGTEPVRILGIQWLPPGSAGQSVGGLSPEEGDFVNLEAAVAFRAKPTSSTTGLKGRSANPHLLTELYLSAGMVVPAWIELTGFLAAARIRVQLTPDPPFFAAMKLTLLGQPKITIKCTPLAKDFFNLMDVPVLSNWLQQSVDSVVAEYVAPKSLTLDLKELLMGIPTMDVEALGVIVVTIRCAKGFKSADETKIFKTGQGGTKGNTYVTLSWNRWGKFVWATRIISKDFNPVWEETTAVLVKPQEVDAQESLRVQLWDADRFTADDLIGTIDVPLSHLMQNNETRNRISIREDQFHSEDSPTHLVPGKLLWECGYFDKMTFQQRMEDKGKINTGSVADLGNYEEVKSEIESDAEKKLREAKTREMLDQQIQREEANDGDDGGRNIGIGLRRFDQTPAQMLPSDRNQQGDTGENQRLTSEIAQQKKEDLEERGNNIIAASSPAPNFPSGILGIRIEQISGLGVHKVRETGVPEAEEGEDEDADDLPSAYCTVLINHQRVYKTRTKMKSSNPYFDANTERFIRSWSDTTVIIAVRDNRLHEKSPILGVVVLPLAFVFRDKSYLSHTLPIVGGIGYGRLKFTMIFRSVQLHLPKRLLGWDVGTLEIQPNLYAVASSSLSGGDGGDANPVVAEESAGDRTIGKKGESGRVLPSDLAGCHLVFRTRYGKGKMQPFHPTHYHTVRQNTFSSTNTTFSEDTTTTGKAPSISSVATNEAEAEWRPKRHAGPLRLPVVKRYSSCLHILLKKRGLGRDTVVATSTLWLKDIPDDDEVTVQLPIRRRSSSGGGPLGHFGGAGPLASVTRRASKDKGGDKENDAHMMETPQKRDSSILEELECGSIGAGGGDIVPGVMFVLRLRFWRGLSGYHQALVKHNKDIESVMEVLDCAEEQKNESGDLVVDEGQGQNQEDHDHSEELTEAESDDEDSWEAAEGDGNALTRMSSRKGQPRRKSTTDEDKGEEHSRANDLKEEEDMKERQSFEEDAKAQRKKPKESHRKHRGLMQWKAMRNMAWVGQGVEEKAEKLGHKIKSGFKHEDREAGMEKEV